MTSRDDVPVAPNNIPHPGEVVSDYMQAHSLSHAGLAQRSGLSVDKVVNICNGTASISPADAEGLEKALFRPAHMWIGLQRLYDESNR